MSTETIHTETATETPKQTVRTVTTTINTQPLIQKHAAEMIPVSTRDLVILFQQLENTAVQCATAEKANFHPVAGRYFKVAVQHERNESYLNKGKKEAIMETVKLLKSKFPLDQRIEIEKAAGDLRREMFDVRNEQEVDSRIRQILIDDAGGDE